MENLIITKKYLEENLLQLRVDAKSKYVSVWQECWLDLNALNKNSDLILKFLASKQSNCYVEFGVKQGNYTPAFSIDITRAGNGGHFVLEIDMEIDDNPDRKHRCVFNIETEYGLLENFAKQLKSIKDNKIDSQIKLDNNSFANENTKHI